MAGKTVCVTGGAGYVASWIIKFLLQCGYTVKSSVRYPNEPKKTNHLMALEGAKERFHLLKANLLEEGSFDPLVEGCEGIFHYASPFFFDCKDIQIELLHPALKGTLNVLGYVSRSLSIKRVILISSEAIVAFNGIPMTPEVEINEMWWSDLESCRKNQMWYVLSNTIVEKAIWEFVKEKGITMVSINPTCIIGPLLQPTLNTSSANILHLINGSKIFPNATYGWIDVKDVANAHILAFEKPKANERYLMVERGVNFSAIVKNFHGHYPDLKLPEKYSDSKSLTLSYRASRKRTESLGIIYTPIEQSVKDTAESLKERGLFKGKL